MARYYLGLIIEMGKFSEQVVFITGASSGIGAALAKDFAREGAKLALCARRRDKLEALASDIISKGGKALVLTCDVTRNGDLEAAVAKTRETFGHIDVVVANAGFGVVGRFEKLKLEDFRRQFETNVFGLLRTVQATLEDLKRSRGRLVLLGSVSGYLSLPESAPYSMSKFAVRALAESLYAELGPLGISVVLISPGFVATEIRRVSNEGVYKESKKDPVTGWLQISPKKAARQIVRATAQRRREKILTFHGKLFITLNRLLPGLIPRIFRRLGKKFRGSREKNQ